MKESHVEWRLGSKFQDWVSKGLFAELVALTEITAIVFPEGNIQTKIRLITGCGQNLGDINPLSFTDYDETLLLRLGNGFGYHTHFLSRNDLRVCFVSFPW